MMILKNFLSIILKCEGYAAENDQECDDINEWLDKWEVKINEDICI